MRADAVSAKMNSATQDTTEQAAVVRACLQLSHYIVQINEQTLLINSRQVVVSPQRYRYSVSFVQQWVYGLGL